MPKGNINIYIVVLITLVLMVGYWLVATPKVDIFKTIQNLPELTIEKISSPKTVQDSSLSKELVIDQKATSKLSTKSIRSTDDLDKIGKDLDSTNIGSIDNSINQIEAGVE